LEPKSGDFFRHPRLGTVRVGEIGSDFISLHQRNGSTVRLSNSEADKQLRPIPSDGFYALIYQREPDAEWLRDNIEDVVQRMLCDRRSLSIDAAEIKRELSPILSKQQRTWTSWWKVSRKKLVSGDRFKIDPQKRNRFLLRSAGILERSSDQIAARIRTVSDPRDLLQMAKELDLYPASERAQGAKRLADSILTGLRGVDAQSQEFPELLCALCYAASLLEGSEASDLISKVPQATFDQMSLPPGLDLDLTFALSVLSKVSWAKWTDFAKALLAHGSPEVAVKALSALNTEANRQFLKTTVLSWMSDAEAATPLRIELYLRKDLLRHMRQADLQRLYSKLIKQPRLWETPTVRQFLNSPDIALSVFSDAGTDDRERAAILCSRAVSPDVRVTLAKSAANPEALLIMMLGYLDSDVGATAAACLPGLIPFEEFSSWKALLEVVRRGHYPDLFSGLVEYLKRGINDSSGPDLLTLAKRAAQLYELAQAEYPESADGPVRSLEAAGRRLQNSSAPWMSPLLQVFRSEIEESKRGLVSENDKLKEEGAQLAAKLKEVVSEADRLRALAEMLKSSASVDKQELEAQIRIEAYRPILLLLDDLERQLSASANSSTRHLISMLASALERAGVRRLGIPGEVCGFDPDFHEFVEEPRELTDSPKVQVLRSGFVLETHRGRRLIRRTVVRMQ
jgi:molecular chaperone GrpE (heat shock protein)